MGTTTTTTKTKNIFQPNKTSNDNQGELMYNKAIEKINEIHNIKQRINEEKIMEQYNALINNTKSKLSSKSNNNKINQRKSSIAVIRTIIKQAREEAGIKN